MSNASDPPSIVDTPAKKNGGAMLPASYWQRAYWRKACEDFTDAALNVAMRWRIEGAISDAAIEHAIAVLVSRHEALRTRLRETPDGLMQEIASTAPARVAFLDLQRLDTARQEADLSRIGQEEAHTPFDLGGASLFRAMLVRTSPLSAVLHLTFHHLIVDGWSIGLLVRELADAAAAFDSNDSARIDDVDLHYADFVLWQMEMLAAGRFQDDLAYWRTHLDGARCFIVAADEGCENVLESDGFIRSILLPSALVSRLEQRAARKQQTLFTQALGALSATLHALTEADEVLIGTQVAGRPDVHSERIVGPLLNTVLLRILTPTQSTLADVTHQAGERMRAAMEHQGLPFEALREALVGVAGDEVLDHRVNFVLQRAYIDTDDVADLRAERFRVISMPSHCTGAQWDLNFFMVGREEGWRLSCEARAARYSPDSVDLMLRLWQDALSALVDHEDVVLAALAPQYRGTRKSPEPSVSLKTSSSVADRPLANAKLSRLRERVIPLRTGGPGPSVMALNITSVLYPVAEALGPQHSFFDLHVEPSLTPGRLPDRDFTDLARDALDLVRVAQPRGPYILFGLCVCGALAFEVAQQLRDEGESVPLVVLNDTWRPGYREDMTLWQRQARAWRVRWNAWRLDWARMKEGRQSLAYTLNKYPLTRLIMSDVLKLPKIAAALGWTKEATSADLGLDEGRWFAEYLGRAQLRYRPAPYDGRVLIFRSEEALEGPLFARDFGWSDVVRGPIDVVACPGEHATMFRAEGAQVIAAHMQRVLAQSDS
jgi:thioesterase domain-containing protein